MCPYMSSFHSHIIRKFCLCFAIWSCFKYLAANGSFHKSPYYQYLPDCTKANVTLPVKKTPLKGILCPMVRNEEGFLSEWVAYYEMQGFHHIIVYDDNSTQSFEELSPWIRSGFVTIKRNWWEDHPFAIRQELMYDGFKMVDARNMLAMYDCKREALSRHIDIHVSLDLDEYLLPRAEFRYLTLMDDIHHWMATMNKTLMYIKRYNFAATPHLQEPVNLLTMEAYLTRYPLESKISYYASVQPKIALWLTAPHYPSDSLLFQNLLLHCCNLHGCSFQSSVAGSLTVSSQVLVIDNFECNHDELIKLYGKYIWPQTPKRKPVSGKRSKVPQDNQHRSVWIQPPYANHYARSLEKFALKQDGWKGSLDTFGNDSLGNPQGLHVVNYLIRNYGFHYDDSALTWTCALRQWLKERTGEAVYLRPGEFWMRNPEFGKRVDDPRKRGRSGANHLQKKVRAREWNPYPPGDTYQKAHKVYDGP